MSTLGLAPLVAIDGPLPLAPRHNLLSVALDIQDPTVAAQFGLAAGGRWQAGVNVLPRPADTPFGWDPCSTGTSRTKETGAARDWLSFLPFVAYLPDFCSGMGVASAWERFKALVDEGLVASEVFAIERQFAQGQPIGDNPSLNDTNLVVLGGGAVGPVEGLSLLENAIGATARAGVIHATPAIGVAWSAHRLVQSEGPILRTVACGTPVVIGHGYIGTDPDAAGSPSGDQEWAFATGPVFYARGELEELTSDIGSSLDRDLNDVVYRAEREVLVGWDGVLQAGVLIDRSATP